jgi:hypothetical protein
MPALYLIGELKELKTSFGVFLSQTSHSANLQQDHFSDQPHVHARTSAPNGRRTFPPCCGVHVEHRITVLIRKEGPHRQNFMDTAQRMKHWDNGMSSVSLRADDQATRRTCPANVYRHGPLNPMVAGKVLNCIGKTFPSFKLQGKNTPDLSFVVLHALYHPFSVTIQKVKASMPFRPPNLFCSQFSSNIKSTSQGTSLR